MLRTPRLALLVSNENDYPYLPTERDQIVAALEGKGNTVRTAQAVHNVDYQPIADVRNNIFARIVRLDDFQIIGFVGSSWIPEPGFCYVGYDVAQPFSGNGYATEAVKGTLNWLLSWPTVDAVVSETFPEAPASIRVMEKCGMALIDANVGPAAIRRAIIKPGANIDIVERNIVKLIPFQYPWTHRLRQLLRGADPTNFTNIVQFRESGMFHADWSGRGGITPWSSFTYYRLTRSGGFELWNGATWFSIPASAFDERLHKSAIAFVKDQEITEA